MGKPTILIENMMQNNEENTEISDNHDEFSYKLQIIEQQIKKIDELLQEENNNINYNITSFSF